MWVDPNFKCRKAEWGTGSYQPGPIGPKQKLLYQNKHKPNKFSQDTRSWAHLMYAGSVLNTQLDYDMADEDIIITYIYIYIYSRERERRHAIPKRRWLYLCFHQQEYNFDDLPCRYKGKSRSSLPNYQGQSQKFKLRGTKLKLKKGT